MAAVFQLHRPFGAAQLDLTIADRFGYPVKPREWFLVQLQVIDEAVARIRDGTILRVVTVWSCARNRPTEEHRNHSVELR